MSLLIRILRVALHYIFYLVWICSFASPDGQATSIISRLSGFRWSWSCGLHTVFPTFSSPLVKQRVWECLRWDSWIVGLRQISALEVLKPHVCHYVFRAMLHRMWIAAFLFSVMPCEDTDIKLKMDKKPAMQWKESEEQPPSFFSTWCATLFSTQAMLYIEFGKTAYVAK